MKTALLIIDMQNYFLGMARDATPRIAALHAFFASRALPTLFTRHGHPAADLTPPYRNQLVRKWGPGGSIRRDPANPDWQLMPAMRELIADSSSSASPCEIVDKNTYDAFVGTNLAGLLEGRGVGRVVVCGVMTDCCCESTARSAFNRGWETWLVADACGSASRAQHERSLGSYEFGFGPTRSTREVISMLEEEEEKEEKEKEEKEKEEKEKEEKEKGGG